MNLQESIMGTLIGYSLSKGNINKKESGEIVLSEMTVKNLATFIGRDLAEENRKNDRVMVQVTMLLKGIRFDERDIPVKEHASFKITQDGIESIVAGILEEVQAPA